jgi:hypothetical protein
MSSAGTLRGTPGRGQGRGNLPSFINNSPSAIPRPASETHVSSTSQSETGFSTMSARQKQSKKDEVCSTTVFVLPVLTICQGNPPENRDGS